MRTLPAAFFIAFRCAVIFHLLSGYKKESKACIDFMLMMADYVLKNRMAGNVKSVYKLLNDLIDAYKPTALKEREELKKMAKGEVKPWDAGFYSH